MVEKAYEYDLPKARRLAGILGESSAASNALHTFNLRKDAGENVVLIVYEASWLVLPREALEPVP